MRKLLRRIAKWLMAVTSRGGESEDERAERRMARMPLNVGDSEGSPFESTVFAIGMNRNEDDPEHTHSKPMFHVLFLLTGMDITLSLEENDKVLICGVEDIRKVTKDNAVEILTDRTGTYNHVMRNIDAWLKSTWDSDKKFTNAFYIRRLWGHDWRNYRLGGAAR